VSTKPHKKAERPLKVDAMSELSPEECPAEALRRLLCTSGVAMKVMARKVIAATPITAASVEALWSLALLSLTF